MSHLSHHLPLHSSISSAIVLSAFSKAFIAEFASTQKVPEALRGSMKSERKLALATVAPFFSLQLQVFKLIMRAGTGNHCTFGKRWGLHTG